MNQPLVSVIMPVYNGEKYVEKAIQSIINQTYSNWELLICDDGSTDNSWEVIEKFKGVDGRVEIQRNKKNQGKVRTVNSLYNQCRGEYLTVHDADDWSSQKRFEIQMQVFEQNCEIGLVGTFTSIVDSKGKYIRSDQRKIDDKEIKEAIKNNNQFCGATLIVKKDLLGKEFYRDFFNEYNYEDYDLSLRISEKTKVANVPLPLYYYRQSAGTLSKKPSSNALISKDLVLFFAEQREKLGIDFVDKKNEIELNRLVHNLKSQYYNDASLVYRKFAENQMYSNLYTEAIKSSVKAIWLKPSSFINYRTLQYCIRKYLLSFFSQR